MGSVAELRVRDWRVNGCTLVTSVEGLAAKVLAFASLREGDGRSRPTPPIPLLSYQEVRSFILWRSG